MNFRAAMAIAVVISGSALSATEPLVSVGPEIPVFLSAAATVRYDDNVFLQSQDKQSDTIFVLMPGIDLHTTGGTSHAGISFNEQFIRYASNSSLNSNLASLLGNFDYQGGVSNITAAASYQELDQSNLNIRSTDQTVQRTLTSASLNGQFGFTGKTSIGTGATFERTGYPKVGFVDTDVWSVPVDLYYAVTSKVDLSAGYNFRRTTTADDSNNSKDQFFNVGARGQFTAKLTGQFRVGITQRHPDKSSSENQLGLNSNLSYSFSPKTSFDLSVSNDFSNSAFGVSQKTLTIGLNGNFVLIPAWSAQAGASFESSHYISTQSRTDKFWVGNLGATYALTTNSALQLQGIYRKNSSNVNVEFNDTVVSFSASIRF